MKIPAWKEWPTLYRYLVGFFCLGLSIFLSGSILIRSPEVKGYIKSKIISYVRQNLDASLQIKEISGNPFYYLRLQDIEMQGPYRKEAPENYLKAREVVVRFSLWELVKGNIGFSSVRILSPSVYLDTKVFIHPNKSPGTQPNFNLRWLELSNGDVTIVYFNTPYQIKNGNIKGSFSLQNKLTNILVRDFNGTVEGLKINQLRGRVSISPNMVEAKSINISGQDIQLKMDGNLVLRQGLAPMVRLNVQSDKLPVDKVRAFFPALRSIPIVGTAKFEVDLEGPMDKLAGKGKLNSSKGQFGKSYFTDLNVKFTSSESHFKLEDVSINLLNGKFKATGEGTYLIKEKVSYAIDTISNSIVSTKPIPLEIKNSSKPVFSIGTTKIISRESEIPFNLNMVFQDMDITQIPKIDPTLSGLLNGRLKLEGNLLAVSSIKGNGVVSWVNGKYRGVNELGGKADVDIRENSVKFSNTRIAMPQGETNGIISLVWSKPGKFNLDFWFDWNSADVGKVRSLLHLPDMAGTGKGNVHGYSDNVQPLLVEGKFQLDNGYFTEIKFNHVDGTIYADRRLELIGTKLVWMNEWPIEKANIQVRFGDKNNFDSRFLNFPRIDIWNGNTQAVSSGYLDNSTHQIQFVFSSENTRLADLPAIQKIIPRISLSGTVNGTISGRGNEIQVSTKFTSKTSKVFETLLTEPINGEVVVLNKLVRLDIKGAGYKIQGTVDNRKPDPEVEINSELNNAQLIILVKSAVTQKTSGTLNGLVTVTGKMTNLQVNADIHNSQMQNSDAYPLSILSGKVTGQLKNGFNNGTLHFQVPDFRIGQPDKSIYSRLINTEMDFIWKEKEPSVVRFNSEKGLFQDIPISAVQGQIIFQDPDMDITYIRFQKPGNFSLQGKMNLASSKPAYQLSISGTDFPINQILKGLHIEHKSEISGLVSGQININGKDTNLSSMNGDGHLTYRQLKWNQIDADNLDSGFQIKNGRFEITKARLTFPKSVLEINGWLDPNQKMDLHIQGTLDNLGSVLEKAKGKADLDVNLSNTWDHPAWKGKIGLESVEYQIFQCKSGIIQLDMDDKYIGTINGSFSKFQIGMEVFDKADILVEMKNPLIFIKEAKITKKEALASVSGQMDIQSGEMKAGITAENVLISKWLAEKPISWIVESQLDLNADFKGNYKNRNGLLVIQKLSGQSQKSELQLQDPIKIEWKDDTCTIQPFILKSTYTLSNGKTNGNSKANGKGNTDHYLSGTLSGKGTISLKDNTPQSYDLYATTDKFSWPIIKGLDAIYEAKLRFNGEAKNPKLSGLCNFQKISINAPLFINEQKSKTGAGKVVALPPFPIQMDLQFNADSAVYLRNELMDLEARGWIKIQTTSSNELEITYELKTLGGYINYRNKKFPITNAEVRHSDPKVFNPYIETVAQTKVRSVDIFMRVYGTLNNYDISLTSDPPYSQSDIFALLATGRTQEELRSLERKEMSTQLAASYAGEQILNTLGSPVIKAVGVDDVSAEYDEIDNDTKLMIKKNLGKKVTASYNVGLGKESNSNAQVEYKLKKNISAIGRMGVNSVTKEASGALDLEWKIPTK